MLTRGFRVSAACFQKISAKSVPAGLRADRLTSPAFHASLSPQLVLSELRNAESILRNPVDWEEESLGLLILFKHAMSFPDSERLVLYPNLIKLAALAPSGQSIIDKDALVREFANILNNKDCGTFSDPSQVSSLVEATTGALLKHRDSESVEYLITHLEDHFPSVLQAISGVNSDEKQFSPKSKVLTPPKHVARLIPPVVLRICRERVLTGVADINAVVAFMDATACREVAVLQVVAASLMKLSDQEIRDQISPRITLKFLTALGYGGYTHHRLIQRLIPSLLPHFKNYQGLTSVLLIAGGIPKQIVDHCMEVIRADIDNGRTNFGDSDTSSKKSILKVYCALIRRLVVCGYYKECMELFGHFDKSVYESLTDSTCLNQIYRLYLASYLAPEIVNRETVSVLRKPSIAKNTENQMAYDSNGVSQSNSSYIHNLVVASLKKLNVHHVSEYFDPETYLVIDVYIPQLKLALEVQGPSHFVTDLETGVTALRPEDGFKRSVLAATGFKTECVSVYEFGRNHATRNAVEYIRELLERNGWRA